MRDGMPSHAGPDQPHAASGADGAWGLRFPTLDGAQPAAGGVPGGLAAGHRRRPRAAERRAAGRVGSAARAPPAAGRAPDRNQTRTAGGRPHPRPSHAAGVRDRAPSHLGGIDDRALDGPARRSTEARFCTRAAPGCCSATRGMARARRSADLAHGGRADHHRRSGGVRR